VAGLALLTVISASSLGGEHDRRGGGEPAVSDAPPRCGKEFEACTESKCCDGTHLSCLPKNKWYSMCRSAEWPEEPGQVHLDYALEWQARGRSFFKGWDFLPDGNEGDDGGPSHFVKSLIEARRHKVVELSKRKSILRAGSPSLEKRGKRMTARMRTKKSFKHFVVAMKYSHVPWGCGIWPAFYTKGVGEGVSGGEMHIMEHVNDAKSFTRFRTSANCTLKTREVNRFKEMTDLNFRSESQSQYDCSVEECENCTTSTRSLGCAPNVLPLRTSLQWAENPGVIAMQRTKDYAKIFFIPHDEIPHDLQRNAPKPETWEEWMIAYYPFAYSDDCPDADGIMSAQQIYLSIQFCGSWASKVWGDSTLCPHVGAVYNASASRNGTSVPREARPRQCRALDPTLDDAARKEDCCSMFIADQDEQYGTDKYLRDLAYFEIDWVKVFT